ncbi:hypothetical protein P170DRAFT_156935 [Aspergillus steynii IBT 23096]|uniref:Hydrophobin n=1 Tax=Aspergillus steynii IBT 23096 TaxID=1392250 RepID=A0A2I2GDK4_9EURO|nr:uncharacterized protein P170DRAFT_156935 [Aspergillus steynii IBT 23096]PLB50952.1 hypothetical protein P170DRAFT_156935 [Aspergillus steynii IBT 23096]
MKFTTAISFLVATGAMVSAYPSNQNEEALKGQVQEIASSGKVQGVQHSQKASSDCVGPQLCCGTLTTPLDPVVDPLLKTLGVDLANIVGSVGLLCHGYDSSCTTTPQCCTEANLLGGTVALGCADAN